MSSAGDALERARASQPAGFEPEVELSLAERALLQELERWRLDDELHAAWVAAGAPPIHSDAEHRRWFGMAYEKPARKRGRK